VIANVTTVAIVLLYRHWAHVQVLLGLVLHTVHLMRSVVTLSVRNIYMYMHTRASTATSVVLQLLLLQHACNRQLLSLLYERVVHHNANGVCTCLLLQLLLLLLL
jgi:hypothetical protein